MGDPRPDVEKVLSDTFRDVGELKGYVLRNKVRSEGKLEDVEHRPNAEKDEDEAPEPSQTAEVLVLMHERRSSGEHEHGEHEVPYSPAKLHA